MLPTKFRFIWPSGFRGEDFFRNQPNGNKLRTYRLYKENVNAEQFVLSNIPRSVRRTMTLFRTNLLRLKKNVCSVWLDFITFQYRYKFLFHG
jgi:hypothetical protein